MSLHSFTHVALRVKRLREAEAYYRTLFALEVAWREAETPDGWGTLPESADWDDAERAGIQLGIVMLHRDGFRLALEAADEVSGAGHLSHLGVFVDEQELRRVRETAASSGCTVVVDREQALIIDDRFGVRWELNTFAYDDPPSMSTGARTGRWLNVETTDSTLNDPRYEVTPIGWVESSLVQRAQAPRQGNEGAPPAWLVFEPQMAQGLRDLRVGDQIIVLTWLDRARRDVLSTHPRDDPDSPLLGIFSTRSPDRPNPIGLHRVEILAVEGVRILVRDLEALNATPILDVKPVLDPVTER